MNIPFLAACWPAVSPLLTSLDFDRKQDSKPEPKADDETAREVNSVENDPKFSRILTLP